MVGRILQSILGQPRVDPNPERLIQDDIGIGQRTNDAIFSPSHIRLLRQISGKEKPSPDLPRIEVMEQLQALAP